MNLTLKKECTKRMMEHMKQLWGLDNTEDVLTQVAEEMKLDAIILRKWIERWRRSQIVDNVVYDFCLDLLADLQRKARKR